ncbi:enterobactin exporter EntS [Streptomyces sp. S4.7]|uniref:MFS transporter n=1 Tax=Streptomyces sp. S4.7 TaxID=2705439 RepID=UPI0013976900|nr:MFS transporter [Streptomyces sp. S4.7]QHY98204.1 enterobactin exporter EntS [Streptomyces sp. S4.7]
MPTESARPSTPTPDGPQPPPAPDVPSVVSSIAGRVETRRPATGSAVAAGAGAPAPDGSEVPPAPGGAGAVSSSAGRADSARPAEVAPGYREVLWVREFRVVFAAHLLSLLGVVVTEISLTVLVYDLTGSPLLSALTFALGFLPYVFGGTLLAGVADRFPVRRVLVVCDLVCAGCVAVMVVPGTPVAGLLALRCAVAAVAPVFTGTRMAALTDILGEGDLYVLGRSLLRIVSQSALLVGFAVGGLLLAVVPPRGAIAITVVTFLCSAALLRFGTKDRPARLLEKDGGANLLRDSLDGARLVFADRRIRALTLLFWIPAMFVVAPEALMAPYADRIGVGPAALGLMMCAMPVGHIAAELVAGSALGPRSRSRIVLPSAALGLLPLLVYAVTPGIALAVVALALSGVGAVYVIGLDQWFVEAVPEELRGRAMTLMTAGLMTVQGLGMALAGLAAEFVPVHQVVAGAGAIGTLCSVLLVYEVRRTGGPRNPGVGADRDMTTR